MSFFNGIVGSTGSAKACWFNSGLFFAGIVGFNDTRGPCHDRDTFIGLASTSIAPDALVSPGAHLGAMVADGTEGTTVGGVVGGGGGERGGIDCGSKVRSTWEDTATIAFFSAVTCLFATTADSFSGGGRPGGNEMQGKATEGEKGGGGGSDCERHFIAVRSGGA